MSKLKMELRNTKIYERDYTIIENYDDVYIHFRLIGAHQSSVAGKYGKKVINFRKILNSNMLQTLIIILFVTYIINRLQSYVKQYMCVT